MSMSLTRLAAIAMGGLAIFIGAGAVSVFTSGNPGLILIVGVSLAVASIGLLVFAFRLWFRAASSAAQRGRQPGRRITPPLSRGQRLGYVAVGVLGLVLAGHALVTGGKDQVRGPVVTRDDKPGQFWPLVLLYGGVGGLLLYRGLRRPPGEPGRRPGRVEPDRRFPGRPARSAQSPADNGRDDDP